MIIKSINFTQTDAFGNKSTVTITDNDVSYFVTSTNNLIICPDCKRMVSTHAKFCPACGCDYDYIVEHWFEHFRDIQLEQYRIEEEKRKEKLQPLLQELKELNKTMHDDDKLYIVEDMSIEIIELQIETLKVNQKLKKGYLNDIASYKNLIDLTELPKYSSNSSLGHIASVRREAQSNFQKLHNLKNEIRELMKSKDMSYRDLGENIKYYDSKSIRDKEALLYIIKNYTPYNRRNR